MQSKVFAAISVLCAAWSLAVPSDAGGSVITGGQGHSCLVSTSGAAQCWGRNESGQLGDGSITQRLVPVQVDGLGSGVQSIAVGDAHTCALTTTGAVRCWGSGDAGRLGDGTVTNRPTPVTVTGLGSGVQAIAAGDAHTCALTTGGGVLCWGYNAFGAIGDGSTIDRNTPVPVAGLGSGVQAITAGERHTCALTTGGGVRCWGFNNFGQLGDGTGANSPTQVSVAALGSGVAAIAAGDYHSCALTQAGGVSCWGRNDVGQLGEGTPTNRLSPVAVSGLASGVASIAAGDHHACVVTTAGAVQCWGSNLFGQQGNGTTTDRFVPGPVAGLGSGIVAVAGGTYHTCAVSTTGAVACWGWNVNGHLGDGTTTDRLSPVLVQTEGAISPPESPLAAGSYHTCSLTTTGGVECWGRNGVGELGDGTTTNRLTPVPVTGLSSGVRTIGPGDDHSCALTTAGAVQCWGFNGDGALGDGTNVSRLTPGLVTGLSAGVRMLAGGESHNCVVTSAGAAQCWGYNARSELGDGSNVSRSTPTPVVGLGNDVRTIAAGERHSCALTNLGGAFCWGDNAWGQLGVGGLQSVSTPVQVAGLSIGIVAIGTGDYHTCALTVSGAVLCWGRNDWGQVGDGTTTLRPTPVQVSGLGSGVRAIAVGDVFSCALTSAGAMKCWGQNTFGGIGDGTTVDRLAPVVVSGLGSGVQAITAGGVHACALTAAGAALCWGYNLSGALGDGSVVNRSTPGPVQLGATTAPVLPGPTVTAPSPAPRDLAGSAVAVADSVLAVAVPGRELVLVFNNNGSGGFDPASGAKQGSSLLRTTGSQWGTAPAAVLSAGGGAKAIGDKFAEAIAVSPNGDTIVVGAPLANGGVGQVQVFHRVGSSWSGALSAGFIIDPIVSAGVTAAGFGASVAIDDNGNIAVGAPGSTVNGISNAGSVHAFRDVGGVVNQNGAALISGAPQVAGGFGAAVAVDRGIVAVGAPGEDGIETDSGAAYVHPPMASDGGNGFKPAQALVCQGGGGIGDKYRCGKSIAIKGDLVVVGAPGADTEGEGNDSGAAEVFSARAGFARAATLRPIAGQEQRAGSAVAINEGAVALGAPTAAITRSGQGRAFVYDIPEAGWNDVAPTPDVTLGSAANGEDSEYGSALALSGRNLVIGAPRATVFDAAANLQIGEAGRGDTYVFDRVLRAGFE